MILEATRSEEDVDPSDIALFGIQLTILAKLDVLFEDLLDAILLGTNFFLNRDFMKQYIIWNFGRSCV